MGNKIMKVSQGKSVILINHCLLFIIGSPLTVIGYWLFVV